MNPWRVFVCAFFFREHIEAFNKSTWNPTCGKAGGREKLRINWIASQLKCLFFLYIARDWFEESLWITCLSCRVASCCQPPACIMCRWGLALKSEVANYDATRRCKAFSACSSHRITSSKLHMSCRRYRIVKTKDDALCRLSWWLENETSAYEWKFSAELSRENIANAIFFSTTPWWLRNGRCARWNLRSV